MNTTPPEHPDGMYARVILADDGSPLSRAAIPRAAEVARAAGSEVLAVRVSRAAGTRADDLDEDDWAGYFTDAWDERARSAPQEAEPHLAGVVDELQARGVPRASSLVLHGDAADALVEAADELDVDLVVLSSRGESGLRRAVLGSVAEELIRKARETAVLLCPPPAEDASAELPVRRLLLPLDGSDVSEAAVPHAAFLARALEAELVLLRVTDSEADILAASMPVGAPPTASISAEQAQRMANDERQVAAESLRALAASLRERGLTSVGVEVVDGNAAAAILDAADRLGVDVVVMATHGRGGLGRLLLGSVADAVVRGSERAAVLLVRPHED